MDGCVPNESGDEGEYNGVPQEKEDSEDGVPPEKEDSGDSVTEVVNEDKSGSEKGELRNLSNENLRAVIRKGRSASGNLREGERRGFPGDQSSQQTHDTKMVISITSDEDDASPSRNKPRKLKKLYVHDSVYLPNSISCLDSLSSFKCYLKAYFFKQAFYL